MPGKRRDTYQRSVCGSFFNTAGSAWRARYESTVERVQFLSHTPPIDLNLLRQASFIKDVEWHETIASTNDRGVTLASDETIATPRLIIAGQQTAGRGRGLNRWWSSAGALTFSLLFNPERDLVARAAPPL